MKDPEQRKEPDNPVQLRKGWQGAPRWMFDFYLGRTVAVGFVPDKTAKAVHEQELKKTGQRA
jgi:hypothetical protein